MDNLWDQRFKKHQKDQLKYLRLIFNDQFVIALIFLLGSLGFWYSSFLKTISSQQWWGNLVISLVAIMLLSVGQLVTLLQKADSTFLMVKENKIQRYLKKAKIYSLVLPFIVIGFGLFVLYPFAVVTTGISLLNYVIFSISIYLLKLALINYEIQSLFIKNNYKNLILLTIFIVLNVSLYFNVFIIIVCSIILVMSLRTKKDHRLFEWSKAISKEDVRSFNIKRFYNLFTDVPGLSSKIVRRKYLDGIFKIIQSTHNNTYLYIYIRGFIRNNEYIGLFLRLVIIEVAILFFVKNVILSMIILSLFIYLVGFQLKPFYKQYVNNIMQNIYPINVSLKLKNFQKIVFYILSIQLLISLIPIIYMFRFSFNTLLVSGIGLLIILIFVFLMLPKDLKKLDE